MALQEAIRLASSSRETRWDFPSSQGRPIRWDSKEEWVDWLVREQGRFAEAAKFLIISGREDMALEIAANVWRLWILSRDIAGGRRFLATVLDKEPGKPSRARALALYGDGLFAFRQGKIRESRERNVEALKIARQVKDPEAEALSHLGLSRVSFEEGDYNSALSHAIEARALAKKVSPSLGQAPLFMHAQSVRMLGRYEEAASLFRESVDLNRRIQDRGMVAAELSNLGFVQVHLGNPDAAERCFNESLELSPSLHDAYFDAMSQLTKALVAFLKGDHAQARSLLDQSEKTLKDSGLELGLDDRAESDWLKQKLLR